MNIYIYGIRPRYDTQIDQHARASGRSRSSTSEKKNARELMKPQKKETPETVCGSLGAGLPVKCAGLSSKL